ncbi:MAG: AAA family ATPase [Bacteroidales bacterium]|nr:AAA family ATPase [Bacteroidales bacterium]
MKKQSNQSAKPSTNTTTELLMASVFLSLEDIDKTFHLLEEHPEKESAISAKLLQQMFIYKELTEASEIKKQVKNRLAEWSEKYGEPTISQYTYIGKAYGIPIDEMMDRHIDPKGIMDLLNCYVVGQDDYKRKLSVAFHIHLMKNSPAGRNLDLPKSSLLVCGPSGSGKTYAAQTLAKNFNKPVVSINCNSIVPVGIVGTTIPDHFTSQLVRGHSPKEMEECIVLLDEFDKILQNPEFREPLQNEILSLTDDYGEIKCRVNFMNNSEFVSIPTRNMMFIYTGVFDGINKIKTGDSIGYCQRNDTADPGQLKAADLLAYGVKPELVGRIRNFSMLEQLTVNDLLNVLNTSLESPFQEYQNYFRVQGNKLTVTDDAKQALAEIASERKLGVRGMKNLLHELLTEEMFHLPAGKPLSITYDFITNHINH